MAKTKLSTFHMGLASFPGSCMGGVNSPPLESGNEANMGLDGAPTRRMFKMASLAVTWMPSSNLWHTKSQKSGQVYHIVLPREAYYISQVSRIDNIASFV